MSEWIKWNGGSCPVKKGTPVQVKYRDGQISAVTLAGELDDNLERDASHCFWSNDGEANDIIAYSVLSGLEQSSSTKQTAVSILNEAASIMDERGKQYDSPEGERSMGKAVSAFNTITGHSLRESEGWLLLQLLKDVRDCTTPDKAHEDSLKDCVAYAALKAEARLEGK